MAQKIRGEVIFTGVGGGGVLLAGELLVRAASQQYEHVVWFPNYSTAVRGGPCECTVIFSDEEIAAPVLSKAQVVVVLEPTQLKTFEGRVRPGGTIIVESTGLQSKVARKDVTVIKVPALETARAMGNPLGSNLILLGAYTGAAKLVAPEFIEKELEARFGDRAEVLALNMEAYRHGLKMAG